MSLLFWDEEKLDDPEDPDVEEGDIWHEEYFDLADAFSKVQLASAEEE